MSKICAKCSKAVYPLEELKCLDKIWHKGCFRCWECSMTLNMKNYKGYDKKPYCSAHYPQTKATVVADTPELQRLARNTELQSQVKYHEEFEKKIKGSKIQISDDPETQRIKQVNSVVSQVEYKGVREKTGNMESRRQSLPPTSEKKDRWPNVNSGGQGEFPKSPYSDRNTSNSIVYSSDGKVEAAPRQKRIGSIADYDPVNENYGSLAQGYNPVSRLSQSQEWEETIPVSPSMVVTKRNSIKEKSIDVEVNEHPLTDHGNKKEEELNGDSREPESEDVFHDERTNSGNEAVPSPKEALHGTDHKALDELKEVTEIKTEEVQNASSAEEIITSAEENIEDKPQEQSSHESKEIHSDTDDNAETKTTFPPSNVHENVDEHASVSEPEPIVEKKVEERVEEVEEGEEETSKSETEEERNQSPEENKVAEGKPLTGTFAALYDYEAQDEDEVGFLEGDQVINCESIDEGWMVGTVVRTGERGMLPANYVEQVI